MMVLTRPGHADAGDLRLRGRHSYRRGAVQGRAGGGSGPEKCELRGGNDHPHPGVQHTAELLAACPHMSAWVRAVVRLGARSRTRAFEGERTLPMPSICGAADYATPFSAYHNASSPSRCALRG